MSPLRILHIEPRPLLRIAFQNVSHGGGEHSRELPLLVGRVEGLSPDLGGLLLTSDLQGVVGEGPGPRPLLAEVLARELHGLLEGSSSTLPRPEQVGVLLGGDLFVAPDLARRGRAGDVRPIWRSFRDRFAWVAGVPGNHDRFGERAEDLESFRSESRIHFLDGDVVRLSGLLLGGVGGVIGEPPRVRDPARPFHRSPEDQVERLRGVLEQRPDLLLLHQGPRLAAKHFPGSPEVCRVLEDWWEKASRGGRGSTEELGPLPLVAGGHRHWRQPLGTLGSDRPPPGRESFQVLGLDTRALLLLPAAASRVGRQGS